MINTSFYWNSIKCRKKFKSEDRTKYVLENSKTSTANKFCYLATSINHYWQSKKFDTCSIFIVHATHTCHGYWKRSTCCKLFCSLENYSSFFLCDLSYNYSIEYFWQQRKKQIVVFYLPNSWRFVKSYLIKRNSCKVTL